MPDVFMSYSKKHRPLTERVAALLDRKESVGPDGKSKRITVWWDQSLKSGDVFHREITNQIDKAGAVVVIWTEGAVASDWVYAEAQRGAAQKKLVPLRDPLLAKDGIPLPFSGFHVDVADNDDAIVKSVMSRLGGIGGEDVAAFAAEQRWLLDPKAEPPLRRTAFVSPGLLLQAKYRVTEFVDFDGRIRDLIDWAASTDNQQHTAGRIIHGPGGLGKTRLMIEVVHELAKEGWLTGFVDRNTLLHPSRGPQLENLIRGGRDACGLLLVLDYAEGRSDEVKALARLMRERERAGRPPARLVLLARAVSDWWRELSADPEVALVFGKAEETMDLRLLGDIPPGQARCDLWKSAVNALKPHLVKAGYTEVAGRDPDVPDAVMAARLRILEQEPGFARPLAIQMEALLWLKGWSPGIGEDGIPPMLDRMIGLEREHWKKVTEGINLTALDRGVAQVTTVQGIEGRERAVALVKEDSAYFGERTPETAAAIIRELAKLYGENIRRNENWEGPSSGGSERLSALEPDLIGEHHVAAVADRNLIESCRRWIETEPLEAQAKRRRDLLTVLQRATQPEHGEKATKASKLLDHLIKDHVRQFAADMIDVATETRGALVGLLDQQLDTFDSDALDAINAALPDQSQTLMDLSYRVAERRAALARAAAGSAAHEISPEMREELLKDLAGRVGTLGLRLSSLGRSEEALAATEEVVDIRRRLAESRSELSVAGLAVGLVNLSTDLSDLGRHEEALAATQEAVDIFRRLAESLPDAFLEPAPLHALASSLKNLGAMLSNVGRREEALAPTKEAVDIHRRLAQSRPDAFLPDLSGSLNTSARCSPTSASTRKRSPRRKRPSTSKGASQKADLTPSCPISRGV
jgi:tetratricopeptide (TPR) repeat protein